MKQSKYIKILYTVPYILQSTIKIYSIITKNTNNVNWFLRGKKFSIRFNGLVPFYILAITKDIQKFSEWRLSKIFLQKSHICDTAHNSSIFCLMGIEDLTFLSDGTALEGQLLS